MAETETATAEQPGDEHSRIDINETVLRSEIAFWQEMIGSRRDALPPEAVERMHHALALAERRLSGLYACYPNADAPNVYQLDPARRKVQ